MSMLTSILIAKPNQIEVVREEVLDDSLQHAEVRLRPLYLGICGSDLHVVHGRHPVGQPPVVMGHELSARVIEVGSEVTHVRVGDIGIIDPIQACGNCEACRDGQPNLCTPPYVAGFRAPGFGRSRLIVPERNVHRAPEDLSPRDLVLAEPAACASHCVFRLGSQFSQDVLLIGAGTIGLAIAQALRITGAGQLTVVEPDIQKRELVLQLGADFALAPADLPEDRSFSGVIDAVARQPTLDQAISHVRPGGRVVIMGVPEGRLSFDAPGVQRFERDLISSGMYVPADFDRAVEWLVNGSFKTAPLISGIYPVREASAAVAHAEAADSIKVLIDFSSVDEEQL